MKQVCILLFPVMIGVVSCTKIKDDITFSVTKTVKVNTCNSFVMAGNIYSICLDSVVNDSRCAYGAACVWMGVATSKFTFIAAGNAHHLLLHTPGFPNTFPADTIINGVHIGFRSLTPHPAINIRYDYNGYKAGLEISK